MSSEGREGRYRDYYPPKGSRPGHVPPQRSERYYEGHQLPRVNHREPREHHHARQDSHWGREAWTPQEAPQSHSANHEGRGRQDRRRPDLRSHDKWEEPTSYAEDGHARSSNYHPSQNREWRAEQRHRNQGYRHAYGGGLEPVNQGYGPNVGQAMRNGQPRTWDVTNEMDGRQRVDFEGCHTEVHQEYPRPRQESSANYASRSHSEAWEARGGNTYPNTHPYQEQHEDDGARQVFLRESQLSESEWMADIHNMLPSQVDKAKGKLGLRQGSLRFRRSLRNRRTSYVDPVAQAWDQQEDEDEPKTETEVLEALSSLRDQPWSLHVRRDTKKRLKDKLANSDVRWYSGRPVRKAVKRGSNSLAKLFQANFIWGHVFKRIEGRFGSSVVAFFNFLRAMIQLNLLLGLVLGGGVVVPAALLGSSDDLQQWGWVVPEDSSSSTTDGNNDPCSYTLEQDLVFQSCNTNYTENLKAIEADHEDNVIDLVQDFLQGTGFLEWTILFVGRFPSSTGEDSHYILGLAYILSIITAHLISLIFVMYFVAKFFRQLPSQVSNKSMIVPNIIFTGWDYTVREERAAKTVRICIMGEIRTVLDDELFLVRKKQRTKKQKVLLLLLRTVINIGVIVLIITGWTGIYFLVDISQKNLDNESSQKFLWQYAPTVTVTAFNFVYPLAFSSVVPYEQYRGHTEMLITLVRCIFVRLTSLIVLMFTNIIVISQETRSCDPSNPYICWETHLGQQMYSILVLDVLIHIVMTFVVDVARKALNLFDNSLCQRLGRVEFFVPTHVLDIIYLQSTCWLSIIFAPILTIAGSLCFCLLFGLKLFTVRYTCVPATRVFRASRSSAMFMTILCLAFLLCLVPNGFALLYLRPSLACSPFRGLDNSWQMFTHYVCQMTSTSTYWIRWVVFTVDEAAVLYLVLMCILLLLAYYFSLVAARNALIRRLETKLKHTAKDKVFLLSQDKQTKAVSAGQ